MKLTLRQKIAIAALAAYWITLFILTHMPIPKIVYQARVSDKWLHFLAYMNLVFLLWFSISPERKASWRRMVVWLILFVAVAYGGIDELTQPYTGRTCDIWDFVSDANGVLAGLAIVTFLAFWQALLAVLAITIFGLTNLEKANLSQLVPITDAVFHIFAYGGFTLVWVWSINLYLLRKTAGIRLLSVISVPIGLLLVVKAGSLLLGRHFAMTDLLFAVLGIIIVALAAYLTGFSSRTVTDRPPVS
ncbi:MAG: VanZ family protein [Sedimentisphaerales bacterium]|jgi:VanZ family protein